MTETRELARRLLEKDKPLMQQGNWSSIRAVIREAADALEAQAEENRRLREALQRTEAVSLQARVAPWMDACFGPEISGDRLERGDRLLEEVLELLQSGEYPRDRIAALTEYVWSRPAGELTQEVGGVMLTLAGYCLAYDLDMHDAGESELARVWTKIEKIRAKQATKPTGSALTQARPDTDLKGSDENDRHQRLARTP